MLVNRLMRQSQQERRIAVQLLQTRHEKEIIRKNRITRETQYEQARLKDFEDALNREAVSNSMSLIFLCSLCISNAISWEPLLLCSLYISNAIIKM